MKNPIYLTEEGKKELEEIIRNREFLIEEENDSEMYLAIMAEIDTYKRILSNSIVLPKIDYKQVKNQSIKFDNKEIFEEWLRLISSKIGGSLNHLSSNSDDLTIKICYTETNKIE